MAANLLRIYHGLPAPMRFVAATMRGFYLRCWRYGPETERLVNEALERDHWSAVRWKLFQEQQLAYVLHRAATRVPYYREQWLARRRRGDAASWEYLENWPVLDKESLRQNPKAFVADDCSIRQMFHEHTSGTTGKPLDLWWSRKTVRAWYALFEARCRRWYGVSRQDRWAILGGQLIVPQNQRRHPFWVWNAALNQLYLSSYHLAPDLIPCYLDALKRYRIKYLFGYSSSLHALASESLQAGRKELQMTVAIANAEPLFDYQRECIGEAFRCPVRETYGMAEIVATASECEQGRLHLWPEVGWVEVIRDESLANCTPNDLVCTGLLNADMPLVRYRVGDSGGVVSNRISCACERTLPILDSVQGRVDDVLYTVDGRAIGRLDPVFKSQLPIREAQIIQEAVDRIRVRYVAAPGFTTALTDLIVQRLQERLGMVKVLFEQVDQVPRESNGKFRSVLSELSLAEREDLRRAAYERVYPRLP